MAWSPIIIIIIIKQSVARSQPVLRVRGKDLFGRKTNIESCYQFVIKNFHTLVNMNRSSAKYIAKRLFPIYFPIFPFLFSIYCSGEIETHNQGSYK